MTLFKKVIKEANHRSRFKNRHFLTISKTKQNCYFIAVLEKCHFMTLFEIICLVVIITSFILKSVVVYAFFSVIKLTIIPGYFAVF